MIDAPHVTSIAPPATRKKYLFFRLQLQLLLILLITISPFAFIILYGGRVWLHDGQSFSKLSLLFQSIFLFGYPVQIYVFGTIVCALTSIALGLFLSELALTRRVRRLTKWLAEREQDAFKSLPLPPGGRDEIADLGRQLIRSIIRFVQTEERNKDLSEQKTLFLSVTAHQLRTPLNELLWNFDSMLDEKTSLDSKKQLMIDANAALKRMSLIINHILASADIDTGRFGYVFEKINVVPIIETLIGEFNALSKSRDIYLTYERGTDDIFPVYADKERLSLALYNLIANAIDYTPKGGTVKISVTPQGQQLEIAVEDTGIGITESELPFLFSKFYRSNRARSIHPDGTGLGLYLAQSIINRHGSEIKVQSKEAHGTRFSFILSSDKKQVVI